MKRHPDRLTESDGLYDNVYNEQLVEPFEDIFDQADAYFYEYYSYNFWFFVQYQ